MILPIPRLARRPDFVQMMDDLDKTEETPNSAFIRSLTAISDDDWIMGQSRLSWAIIRHYGLDIPE